MRPEWASSSCFGRALELRLGEEHVLDLGVERDGVHAHLAPDATLLVPAERCLGVHAMARVHADNPGPDPFRHADRAPEIARPDRPRESVLAVVRDPDGFLL